VAGQLLGLNKLKRTILQVRKIETCGFPDSKSRFFKIIDLEIPVKYTKKQVVGLFYSMIVLITTFTMTGF